MKASELRIGNWIENGIGVEFQVNHLTIYEFDSAQLLLGSFTPIHLTEEWLLKFGFDNVRKNMLMCHNEFHNRRINEGAYYVETVGDAFNHWYLYHKVKMITSNIRYVHELQNLYFALTGEELNVNN